MEAAEGSNGVVSSRIAFLALVLFNMFGAGKPVLRAPMLVAGERSRPPWCLQPGLLLETLW